MQSDNVRVRINFGAREVEISGSKEDVTEWWDRLDPIVKGFAESHRSPAKADNGRADERTEPVAFGEYFNEFPSSITDVEKMLAAAYFVQRSNESDKTFTTAEAGKLLSDHGIKLANPSQCVKQNVDKKHVFPHDGAYRVSKPGIDRLNELKKESA